jgi:hypothetical protein
MPITEKSSGSISSKIKLLMQASTFDTSGLL